MSAEIHGPADIPPPEIRSLGPGAGYICEFGQAMARLTIDGLRQGRDGLKGDVRVEVGPFALGEYKTLTEARMDLASMSQREGWERRLRKRWPQVGWDEVLDHFCAAVLRAEKRLDTPAVLLRDAERPLTTGMLLDPLVLAGMPTLWYGDGGTAKSYLALAAALSLHLGLPLIGEIAPAQPMRVLYCDFEFDVWEHSERMRQLLGGAEEEMPDIAYLDCKGGTIVTQMDRIRAAARDYGSQFVVIDSVSYAADGPLNDDETARVYYRVLGYIGLPSLSTAHVPKNGDQDAPFGSVHWKNLCRLAWHFQLTDAPSAAQIALRLTNKKSSTGRRLPALGLLVRFGEHSVQITSSGATQPGDGAEAWRQIRTLLLRERRTMGYEEIGLALALDPAQIKARVHDHKDIFMVLPPTDGRRKALVGVRSAAR